MSNHYHLAIETPKANLADGMHWLQSTFSTRFNRLRAENGHLFQGRYKSLLVDSNRLGPLCHYIHLNPVRAKLCTIEELADWRWTSLLWLMQPKQRATWYCPEVALGHAGELSDSAAGRKSYGNYLAWLSEDEPAQKEMRFEEMSTSWAIGSPGFKKDLMEEHKQVAAALRQGSAEGLALRQLLLDETLDRLLARLGKQRAELAKEGKSVSWKVAIGAAMKQKSTATNRWLSENLYLGNLHEVSRKINHWLRAPDRVLARKLSITPNPMA